jgi:phenylalanyl-tRNA synthetase beta subunit
MSKCGIYVQYPPCYKDMSFWTNESFTENNLCEVVRGIAGDLVEEVWIFFSWGCNFFC